MKKILLTLFAFATVFVACDKDNYEDQFEATAPEVEEINATVESNPELDAAFNFINSLNDAVNSGEQVVSPKSSKGASASKAGDFGNNWIQILFFDYTLISRLGERDYALVLSDNYPVACADVNEDASNSFSDVMLNPSEISYSLRPHPRLANRGFSELIVETIGSTTSSRTTNVRTADWQTTFNADFNRIYAAQANRSSIAGGIAPPTSRFDVTCSTGSGTTTYEYGTRIIGGAHDGRVIIPSDPTNMDAASNPSADAVGTDNIQLQVVRREAGFGVLTWENVGDPFTNPNYVPSAARWEMTESGGVKTFTHADLGSYRVEAAPFPLRGSLATMMSKTGDAASRTVLNYAGTAEQAVRDAIEDDYEGN